jgi:hypothetical protein
MTQQMSEKAVELAVQTYLKEGWTFAYEPETQYIGANHPQGGRQSACQMTLPGPSVRDAFGSFLADALNGSPTVGAEAEAVGGTVKPLDWRDMTFRGVEEWHAWHPFGDYRVTYEGDFDLPYVCRPFPSGPSNYATADEAKAAAEADYSKKMGYALSPSSGTGVDRDAVIEECKAAITRRAEPLTRHSRGLFLDDAIEALDTLKIGGGK